MVIVGSGAGGGTVAKKLAPLCRDGARILVLEWGPRLAEEEFAVPPAGRELAMARKLDAAEIDPDITVMALADRVAERVRARLTGTGTT